MEELRQEGRWRSRCESVRQREDKIVLSGERLLAGKIIIKKETSGM